MSHHSCSEGSSILKVATGIVLGIWAAKIIPILIVGVVILVLWLLCRIGRSAVRAFTVLTHACSLVSQRLMVRYSPFAALMFWVVLLAIPMGLLGLLVSWLVPPMPGPLMAR